MRTAKRKQIEEAVYKLMLENKLNRSITNDLVQAVRKERESDKYFIYVEIRNTRPLVSYVFNSDREIRIGRDQDNCSICIQDPYISRQQGKLFQERGFLYIENMAMQNQIVIKRGLRRHVLSGRDVQAVLQGDTIIIGEARLKALLLHGAAEIVN